MASSTFKPKRIKLEILKSNNTDGGKQFVKLIPLSIKSTGQEVQGKICNLVPAKQNEASGEYSQYDEDELLSSLTPQGYETPKKSSGAAFKKDDSLNTPKPKMIQEQAMNSVPPRKIAVGEQEAPQTISLPSSLPTDEVVSLSDTSDMTTEADPDELEKLQQEFIEEASVLNDDVIDDLEEFFVNPPISDESHDRIVKEILEERIDSFTKDCIQHQIKLIDAEVQTEQQSVVPQTVTTSVSPFKPITERSRSSSEEIANLRPESPKHGANINTEVLNYLKRMEARLISIEQRLGKIEETKTGAYAISATDSEDEEDEDDDVLMSLKFPFKKRSQLELLEGILKVPRMKQQLDLKFRQQMGINESDTIDMILSELLDTSLQQSFRWRQSDIQRSFENYVHINKLIFDCVKHHYRMFSNVEYTRLLTLILNRPSRQSAIQTGRETPRSSRATPSPSLTTQVAVDK